MLRLKKLAALAAFASSISAQQAYAQSPGNTFLNGYFQQVPANRPGGPSVLDATGTLPVGGIGSPGAATNNPTGTTDLYTKGVRTNLNAWDGSTQARVTTQQGAMDHVRLQGGIAGLGPTIISSSDTDTTVPLNFYASGPADYWFNDGWGTLLHIYSPGAMTTNWPKITGSATGIGAFFEADGGDTNIDVGLIPKGTGAILVSRPDGTALHGNARGAGAIDLQFDTNRSAATQVASGPNSMLIGGNGSTASASRATGIACQGCMLDGQSSSGFGAENVNAFTRLNTQVYGHSFFHSLGDAQTAKFVAVGTSTGAGVRLTTNGSAATLGGRNCLFVPPNTSQAYDVSMVAHDFTAPGSNGALWKAQMLLDRATGNTTVTLGTPTTLGAAITVTAVTDTVLAGCVILTATPATATGAHEVHFVAHIQSAEAS